MTTISIRLPDSLHAALRELAAEEHVSINQLVMLAVAEKVTAHRTVNMLQMRAARADRAAFDQVLAKIPAREPDPEDQLTSE